MIHPSYVELMRVLNTDVVIGEEPVVNSRYSIVCAAAKRARQLIDGSEPVNDERKYSNMKPLSIAVDELWKGDLKILNNDEADEEEKKIEEVVSSNREQRAKLAELVAARTETEEE